eukprot:CAMPEP_0170588860 /NCGR_PEP_ID=MMETSP0224-20130122/11055_1 /TAXON_ID=285029 /ORGANISM="Togula jolla, Strain CCCM 725" /LENGTH=495 /DNA_ID=CAMNT_0010912605 /DNA_START=112 /DNA_END=1599 /DNA_ORIENTATION=-
MSTTWMKTAKNLACLDKETLNQQVPMLTVALCAAAVLFATVPLQIPELTIALFGAIIYAWLHMFEPKKQGKTMADPYKLAPGDGRHQKHKDIHSSLSHHAARSPKNKEAKQACRKPSAAPISAPTFQGVGWEAEVGELLGQIRPTAEGDRIVKDIVRTVKRAILPLIPEAEVTGFASGNPARRHAYGVAVPEIDIVLSASTEDLLRGLDRKASPGGSHVLRASPRKLQKAAIRACTDQLVSKTGFKFRRSAFGSEDPKVTLLAPGASEGAVSLNFSVNSTMPLHSAAVLMVCGDLEPRATELILLVRRWARDRGISHAAKGHLPPYAWSLLAVYFLQAGSEDGSGLLPPLAGVERSAALAGKARSHIESGSERSPSKNTEGQKSTAALFQEFLHFYAKDFNYSNEAVSVRLGRRAPPELALPVHVIVPDSGDAVVVAPSIEDPFDVKRNLGSCMTAISLQRLQEELSRADAMCSSGCSLATLLEPWVPPELEQVE